jgi:hypothetical protein
MIESSAITKSISDKIRLEPLRNNAYQIIAPFFHEDGDMLDIFLREREGRLQICDFGTTLMRLSYRFEINTENKNKILSKILTNNGIEDSGGNFILDTSPDTFFPDLLQFQMAIAKVSNMEILRKEYVTTMFFEYLNTFVLEDLGKHFKRIEQNYRPTGEPGFETDFAILDNDKSPVYIMGIRSDLHASRSAAFCLRMAMGDGNPLSIAVHENPDALSKRDRDALTNAVYKQYTSLNDFKARGQEFIMKNIVA